MFETLLALFAVGTLWFWILMFFASIIFIAAIENDHYTLPTIVAVVLGVTYWKSIASLPWQGLLIGFGIYVAIGIAWSVFRWYRWVTVKAAEYRKRYGDTLTPSRKDDIQREIEVSYHKAKLTAWVAWWPWSMIWNLTGDFFNMIYETMLGVYQKIADRAIGNFKIEDPEEKSKKKKEVITDAERNYNPRY